MSDTYNYNSGSPLDMVSGMMGCMCNGNNNKGFDLMSLLGFAIVAGVLGITPNGGGFFGGNGRNMPGGDIPSVTASLVGQQQVADRVSSTAFGIDQILGQTGGIINQVQRTSDRVQDGFSNLNTYLCQSFNNSAMQGVNNYNGLTGQLTDIRFDAQKCCCETQNMIQGKFCELGYRQQADKNDVISAVAASEARILAQLNADKTQRLQEKLAKAEAQLSQNNQTASIVAAIQANCAPKCGCNAYPYGFNPCANKCGDLLCSVQNAFADEIAQRIINPTTTATAA